MSIAERLEEALQESEGHLAADVATIELARLYAVILDQGLDVDKIGPKFLSTLESLLMSPKARGVVLKEPPNVPTSPLDELRARRERRAARKS